MYLNTTLTLPFQFAYSRQMLRALFEERVAIEKSNSNKCILIYLPSLRFVVSTVAAPQVLAL
jgi:hypothetical protein